MSARSSWLEDSETKKYRLAMLARIEAALVDLRARCRQSSDCAVRHASARLEALEDMHHEMVRVEDSE